jgi:hypothetical protein
VKYLIVAAVFILLVAWLMSKIPSVPARAADFVGCSP